MARKDQLTTADHFKYDEFCRLLKELRNDKEYLFETYALLSFCTACRASDVRHFRWNQFIGKDTVVVREQKTGKVRSIPLNPSVRQQVGVLYKLLNCPEKDCYIFESRKGEPWTIQHINRKLKLFKEKYELSIKNFSTHTFRKTFGRYVYDVNNGSSDSLLLLNTILSHSSIDITKRYLGITQDEINKIFDFIAL